MTLIGDPQIIFLDEPTTGLDPRSRQTMWQIIRQLAAAGVTIFLTTQNLDEADRLADHIAVLDHGRVIAEDTPDELKRRIPGSHVRLYFHDLDGLQAANQALGGTWHDTDALVLGVPTDDTPQSLMSLLGRIDQLGVGVEHVTLHTPGLDDVFFALTDAANRETERTV